MLRRIALITFLAALAVGCSAGTSGPLNDLFEQARLDDPLVQRTYAEHQAEIETTESIPTLVDHLATDPSPKVRQWCALILGRIGDAQAVPALTAALSDTDAGTRDRAVAALGEIGAAEAEGAFIEALGSGSRDAKITVLVELEKALSVNAIPAIAELASANDGMTSKNAIDTLGGIGDASAVPTLVALALDGSTPVNLRHAAILNLGRIDAPEADAGLQEVITGLADQPGTEALLEFARGQG